jgi:DNA-directed RNA polymerase specialized sigma24 family protein
MNDENQKVIDWLNKVRMLDELINAKQAERDQLWTLATKVTPEVSDMPHGGGVSDKVGNIAAKLADMAGDLDDLVDQYVNYKQTVINALEKLPPKQYGTLHRYYIRYMTWEEVAADMGVSSMSVWRYWQNGLKNLADVVDCYTIPVV